MGSCWLLTAYNCMRFFCYGGIAFILWWIFLIYSLTCLNMFNSVFPSICPRHTVWLSHYFCFLVNLHASFIQSKHRHKWCTNLVCSRKTPLKTSSDVALSAQMPFLAPVIFFHWLINEQRNIAAVTETSVFVFLWNCWCVIVACCFCHVDRAPSMSEWMQLTCLTDMSLWPLKSESPVHYWFFIIYHDSFPT